MDLSEPARALAPGLTVPVLRVLARRTTPATASQIWRAARSGTLAGVQRACDRLVEHGVVDVDEAGGRMVYAFNDDHVLADAATTMVAADTLLRRRMVAALREWTVEPVSALLHGSAARRDGGVASDIDLLLVRPTMTASGRTAWGGQVRALTFDVRRWTGNRLEVADLTRMQVRRLARSGEPIVDSWLNDGITLAGDDIEQVLGRT